MNDFPWLTVLIVVPLVGAVVTAAMPYEGDKARPKQIALGFSLLTLVLAAVMATQYDAGGGFQFTETHEWINVFGAHYALGVDGLGLVLVLLTAVLVPVVIGASWFDADQANTKAFFAWALALESASLGVFTATDVFLFYVLFEASLVPGYFLIGHFGREGRQKAAIKFLIFQLFGGLVMLAAVVGLYAVAADAGHPTYLLSELATIDIDPEAQKWLFVGFFFAFAVKAPLFPVHTWLADATEKATPGTSVLLVCILDKIGTYAMLRYCLGLFPDASQWATPVVVTLALISIVYGALVAIGQDDMLRLIGLTSLSHFGFIVLGIFVFTSQGTSGSILYMVNHGVATAALFLAAGYLVRRKGTASISAITGAEKTAPVLAGVFLVAGLAVLGLPGLSQFVSEIMVIIAAFQYQWWVGAIAVSAIVLAAWYILWMYQRTFTGPGITATEPFEARKLAPQEPPEGDLDRREIGTLAPLLVALVLFGFYPMPLLDVINPAATTILENVGVQDPAPTIDGAAGGAAQEADH